MSDERPRRRTLYRDKKRGKLFGVCAGIADYLGYELWLVRIVTVTLMLFTSMAGGPLFIAYFILAWVLDDKSALAEESLKPVMRDAPYRPDPLTVWRAGSEPKQTLDEVGARFAKMEQRLRSMEGFVTSSRFQWEKQFQEINR